MQHVTITSLWSALFRKEFGLVRSPNQRCDHGTMQCAQSPHNAVRLPNHRCGYRTGHRTGGATTAQYSALNERPDGHRTMLCAYRTTGAVMEQACATIEQAVRPPHNAVRSPNHRCGYGTGLCDHRTGGATTAQRMECAHRTTGAGIEQACATIEPAVRPLHNAVRSPNHRAVIEQVCALTEPAVRPPHNAVRSPNHRAVIKQTTAQCSALTKPRCCYRTAGSMVAQACSITAPVVR